MKDGQMNDEMITQPLGTELLSARKQKYEIRNQNASRLLTFLWKKCVTITSQIKEAQNSRLC